MNDIFYLFSVEEKKSWIVDKEMLAVLVSEECGSVSHLWREVSVQVAVLSTNHSVLV